MVFKRIIGLLTIVSIALLPGCASYQSRSLEDISYCLSDNSSHGISVASKAFDEVDCKTYLDRDVLAAGFQPVQLYIRNDSNRNYVFSYNRLSIPTANPLEVAEKVHTSTKGQAMAAGGTSLAVGTVLTGWQTGCLMGFSVLGGIGFIVIPAVSLFYAGVFGVPAVIAGSKSNKANAKLDQDFADKAPNSVVIESHSDINTLFFVPQEDFKEQFDVTLIDEATNAPKTVTVNVCR